MAIIYSKEMDLWPFAYKSRRFIDLNSNWYSIFIWFIWYYSYEVIYKPLPLKLFMHPLVVLALNPNKQQLGWEYLDEIGSSRRSSTRRTEFFISKNNLILILSFLVGSLEKVISSRLIVFFLVFVCSLMSLKELKLFFCLSTLPLFL